jgi:2-succinyl-6-hydroxy-2,4-cyclohexadiene-1-carboxylate synthase
MIGERIEIGGQGLQVWRWVANPVAPPLLLLHGFTGSPASWAGVVETLAQEAPVAAAYLPGHDPRLLELPATFEEAVARLTAALPSLHPPPWRVAGYSMGGRVALGLLVHGPELFSSAVLVGVDPGLTTEAERAARRAWEGRWTTLLRREGIDAFVDAWGSLPLFASQGEVEAGRMAAQRAIRRGHNAEGLARAMEVLGLGAMPDYWPHLSGLTMAVRLVVGERDPRFRGIAERALRELPRGTATVVPGAGHNVVLEAPGEVVGLLRVAKENAP